MEKEIKQNLVLSKDDSLIKYLNNLSLEEIEEFFDLDTRNLLKNHFFEKVNEKEGLVNLMFRDEISLNNKEFNKLIGVVDLDFLFICPKFCEANFHKLNMRNKLNIFSKFYKTQQKDNKISNLNSLIEKSIDVCINNFIASCNCEQDLDDDELSDLTKMLVANEGMRKDFKRVAKHASKIFNTREKFLNAIFKTSEEVNEQTFIEIASNDMAGIARLPQKLCSSEFGQRIATSLFQNEYDFSVLNFNIARENPEFAKKVYNEYKDICDDYGSNEGVSKQQFCVRFLGDDFSRVVRNLKTFEGAQFLLEDKAIDLNDLYNFLDILKSDKISANSYRNALDTIEKQDIKTIYEKLTNSLKVEFAKEINKSVLDVSKLDNYNEGKTKVFELKGEEFYLLVHNMGTSASEAKDTWESKVDEHKVVSLSLLDDNFCGIYDNTDKNRVLLGFENIDENSILHAKTADAFSPSKTSKYGIDVSPHRANYKSAKDFVYQTRFYNEIVCKEKNNGKNLMPAYVVSLGDIKDKDRETAKSFGIPILKIDEKMYTFENRENLTKSEALVRNFDY